MENQALFSPKDKSKKLKGRLLQFLFGTLRVKNIPYFGRASSPIEAIRSSNSKHSQLAKLVKRSTC